MPFASVSINHNSWFETTPLVGKEYKVLDDEIYFELQSTNILGTKTTEKRKNGDIVETRTGSYTNKYVPSIYIVIEDELTKKIIDLIVKYSREIISRKYIFSGVWSNQASCIFGFLLYADKLKEFNIPSFSIMAVDDGDVTNESKEKRLTKFLKGDFLNKELEQLKEETANLLLSLQLETIDYKIKGLPEYNHKKWFEEITEEKVNEIYRKENIDVNDADIQRKISSLMEIINHSKTINPEMISNDYHNYYKKLSEFSPSNTDFEFLQVEHYVLNSIRKYNHEKWLLYTNAVKNALFEINKMNKKNFVESEMFFGG